MCMCFNTYLCTAAHMHDMLVLTSDSESATLKTYKTIPISVCFHTLQNLHKMSSSVPFSAPVPKHSK